MKLAPRVSSRAGSVGSLDSVTFSYAGSRYKIDEVTSGSGTLFVSLADSGPTAGALLALELHVGSRSFLVTGNNIDDRFRNIEWFSDVPSWSTGQKVALSLRNHWPSAPRGLAAEPGTGEVTLRWAAPASDGGYAVTSYWYRQSTDGGDNWGTWWTEIGGSGASTTSHTVGGLTDGTEYTFEVLALNARGGGDSSNRASATPFDVPGAPTGLAASAGHGHAALAWTAPASDGGSELTGYEVRRKAGSAAFGDWADTGSATTTALTVAGLANGTAYTFEVRAVNAAGEGAASNQASATPAAGTGARMILAVRTCRTYGRPLHRSQPHRRRCRHGRRPGPDRHPPILGGERLLGRPGRQGDGAARPPGGDAGGGGARRCDGHRGGGL